MLEILGLIVLFIIACGFTGSSVAMLFMQELNQTGSKTEGIIANIFGVLAVIFWIIFIWKCFNV